MRSPRLPGWTECCVHATYDDNDMPVEDLPSPANAPSAAPDGAAQPDARDAGFDLGLNDGDVVPLLALLAGIASVFTGQQPTGNVAADALLTFAFVAIVTWFAARASTLAMLIASAAALFFSGFTAPAFPLALAGFLVALAGAFGPPMNPSTRAIIKSAAGALTVLAALFLPDIGFDRSASLFAAVTVAPLLISGFQALPQNQARIARRVLVALLAVAAVASVLAVGAALSARTLVESGIDQAEAGVDAVEQGDQPQAVALLGAAEADFEAAHARLAGPWTWPARFVPIVAQHSRALETAADQGATLAATAARTVNQADVEKIRGTNGQIDLSVVRAVNVELSLANATLTEAQQQLDRVNSPWLLPLLSDRLDDVGEELTETAEDIDLANHATSVVPAMLGGDEQRRYLVLFIQPAESREYGGLVGAYALLEVDQGRMNLAESGSIFPDFGLGEATFTSPEDYPASFLLTAPNVNPQNLTTTPDLSTILAAAVDLAPQWRENPSFSIDGIITIDPYALAAFLELTGPLQVPGQVDPIDANNVVDYLLRDQYAAFDALERDQRQDVLRVLAGEAFGRLFSIDIPGPERLGALFGPAARANRLSMATVNSAENAFLDRVYLSADLPQVGGAVEMLGIYTQTATASKLDSYAFRTVNYDVMVDPATGQTRGALSIIERNDAPSDAGGYVLGADTSTLRPDGEPLPLGDNLLATGIYTRGVVEGLKANAPHSVREDVLAAFSYDRNFIIYAVERGTSTEISATISHQVEPERYDLFVPAQATANLVEMTLTVRTPPGWRFASTPAGTPAATLDADGSGRWTHTFSLDEARGYTFTFVPNS